MEAKELFEKLKNGQASYEDLLKWCIENKEQMDLNEYYSGRLYNTMVKHSMQTRIGNLSKDEADLYIRYFSNRMAKDLKVDKKVVIEVLETEKYQERDKDNSQGICIPNDDGTYTVSYNISKLGKALMSKDKYEFLFGLQTIFHEMRHVTQNTAISIDSKRLYKKSLYIMAMETVTRKISPKFYKDNYSHLFKENDANKVGLRMAVEAIQEMNPKLYGLYKQETIEKLMQQYDENAYESEFEIYGSKGDSIKSLDSWTEIYVEDHPEILQKYPVLRIGYNEDGKKKDLLQMLGEREGLIKDGKKEELDELYKVVLNRKFFDREEGVSTEGELLDLDTYIERTGTDDEFIYDLIRYRLSRSDMTQDQIETFIAEEKEKAANARKKREEEQQEKEPQHEKSIKDEVGDEAIKDEQEEEQIWINRMQLCYRKSTQVENYPDKQKDAIKAISEQLREKDQKEIDAYLGKE